MSTKTSISGKYLFISMAKLVLKLDQEIFYIILNYTYF